MPKYKVHGRVSGPVILGEFEAESPEDAIEQAIKRNRGYGIGSCTKGVARMDLGDAYDVEAMEVESL